MEPQSSKIKSAQLSKLWNKHLEKWELSGLSQNEYCRRNDLRPNQFTYWKCKLKKQTQTRIVPVPMPLTCASPGLKLNIGLDLQIEIPDDFSQVTLERVLTTLKIVS